jgi:hypothetical protein
MFEYMAINDKVHVCILHALDAHYLAPISDHGGSLPPPPPAMDALRPPLYPFTGAAVDISERE